MRFLSLVFAREESIFPLKRLSSSLLPVRVPLSFAGSFVKRSGFKFEDDPLSYL
jgi:hypothetical protein